MGKYSEVLQYEEILDLVRGKYTDVLIIGCGSCMNESIAIKNNELVFYKDKDIYPPVENECIRLSDYLSNHGIKAVHYIIKSGSDMGCIRNAEGLSTKIEEANGVEAILAISCLDGVYGISDHFRGRHIPIYHIARWKGVYYLSYKEEKKCKCIVSKDVEIFG